MKRRDHYPQYWPEQAEEDERRHGFAAHSQLATPLTAAYVDQIAHGIGAQHLGNGPRVLPSWAQLEREGLTVRSTLCESERGRQVFAKLYEPREHHKTYGTIVAPPPESFNIRNPQHFQFLPTVDAIKERAVATALRFVSQNTSSAMMAAFELMHGTVAPPELVLTPERKSAIETVVRAEQAHILYHKAMWREHGRRVAVLDPFTYHLLAATELPSFPAKLLSMPWASFYIVLPPKSFEFEVQDIRSNAIDKRFAEGIAIALDHPEPEYDGVRELSFMVMGEDEGYRSEGRNSAFATIRFGPDATLDTFDLSGGLAPSNAEQVRAGLYYGADGFVGSDELNVVVPRVIVGLLLYLASEHPDIVPIAPPPRRSFTEIRSPAQRDAALRNERERLKRATRLPVLVVGSRIKDEVDRATRALQDADAAHGKRWTLDHAVPVRGHWRQQAYGKNRELRRPVWIRPFWRGPDAAESLVIRAARVPKARSNPEPNILTRAKHP